MQPTMIESARREAFERFCAAVAGRLPGRLGEVVAPSMIGFALINGFTFVVDLLVGTVLRVGLHSPLWLAIGLSYAVALTLSFLLNRALNFRTRRPMGRQLAVYVPVVLVNYVGIVVGVTTGLVVLGVAYPAARLSAGLVEAVFMYSAMRWLVFRDRPVVRRRR